MRPLVFIMAVSVLCLGVAQEKRKYPAKAYITGDRVNVRCGPGTNYRALTKLNKGDRVVVVGKKGEWFKIEPPEKVIFLVDKRYVNRFDGTGKVLRDGLSVWSGRTAQDAKVGYLKKGQKVTIVGDEDRWYKIKPPEGTVLYVFGRYVAFGDKPDGRQENPLEKALKEKEKQLQLLKEESDRKLSQLRKELEKREKKMLEALRRYEALKKEFEKARNAYLKAKQEMEKEKRMREMLETELRRAREQIEGLKDELKKVEESAKREVRERLKPAPISRYVAVGWLDDMGPYVTGPEGAKFCLRQMKDGPVVAYLKPGRADVRLERFLYRRVGIRGSVKKLGDARLIIVESLDDLSK